MEGKRKKWKHTYTVIHRTCTLDRPVRKAATQLKGNKVPIPYEFYVPHAHWKYDFFMAVKDIVEANP